MTRHHPPDRTAARPVTLGAVLRTTLILALALTAPRPALGQTILELAPFRPYLDQTWKAVFDADSGAGDVVRWEPALAGRAIRIVHSVRHGVYGGETFVMWDREAEEFSYTYFTTAGFFTRGTMWFDDEGVLHSRERVTGDADGVTEVRATQMLLDDGALRIVTRMLRGDAWEDAGDVIYRPAPDANVVLPRTGG